MEWQLFEPGTVPEWTTPEWYADRDRADHLSEPLHLGRLLKTAEYAIDLADDGASTLVDLGAGDGGLLSLVANRYQTCWGYDLQPSNTAGALERGVNVYLLDVVAHPGRVRWADVAVCTEMLEHLVDPHAFVEKIAERSTWLICSSPWTETGADHYGFHTWAWDMDGYRALVEDAGLTVLRHEQVGMFQVLLAV